jgi:hypothetical protein
VGVTLNLNSLSKKGDSISPITVVSLFNERVVPESEKGSFFDDSPGLSLSDFTQTNSLKLLFKEGL